MGNQLIKILVFTLLISSGKAFAFSERGMLPMDTQWWECKVGMVIECKTEECPSICASKLSAEKEEKELQRLEETKEVIKQGTEEAIKESKEEAQPQ